MFGVVLWSDAKSERAVIWCEDHGELAFFTADEASTAEGHTLETGDLVRFELREAGRRRRASRPRVISQNAYPSLSERLAEAGEEAGDTAFRAGRARPLAGVVVPIGAGGKEKAQITGVIERKRKRG